MCVIITNSDIKQASLAALEEFFEEDDSECDNAEMILALMKDFDALRGCLEDQRDEIAGLKEKVKRLEARPILTSEPLLPYRDERQLLPDSPYGGWTITCNCSGDPKLLHQQIRESINRSGLAGCKI